LFPDVFKAVGPRLHSVQSVTQEPTASLLVTALLLCFLFRAFISMKMAVFWAVNLMMEAASTFEMLVSLYQTTRRYNPEDSHLHTPAIRTSSHIFLRVFLVFELRTLWLFYPREQNSAELLTIVT
jgi:hypothetical protein